MRIMQEVVEQYLDQNQMHHFEGTTGVRNLETLFGAIGYTSGSFFQDRIRNFLADNPGAIDALIEFITDSGQGTSWQEALESELPSEDEEEEQDIA